MNFIKKKLQKEEVVANLQKDLNRFGDVLAHHPPPAKRF